jgi:hypothetical protein
LILLEDIGSKMDPGLRRDDGKSGCQVVPRLVDVAATQHKPKAAGDPRGFLFA